MFCRDWRRMAAGWANDDSGREALDPWGHLSQHQTGGDSHQSGDAEHFPDALSGLGKKVGWAKLRFDPGRPFAWGTSPPAAFRASLRALWGGRVCHGHVSNGLRPALRESWHRLVSVANSFQLPPGDYGV